MSVPDAKTEPAEERDDVEAGPPRKGKPFGWSTFIIAVLVAVSAALVWRRDGFDAVWAILFHDVSLFGEIMPRVLAGCLLGGLIAAVLPHDKVSKSLGPESGLKGLLIGTPIRWRARCSLSARISARP